jgi:membrane protease YdiL (CAAX protease family)
MNGTPVAQTDRPPGTSDALRATVGVVCAYAAALVVAGLVAFISGAANDGLRSAGDTRAQLAIQAVIFACAALLLVEGLRLSHYPRERNPLAAAARESTPPLAIAPVLVIGLAAAVVAQLVGPAVDLLLPNLTDAAVPVDDLGLGTGLGADLGTVFVVVGLVPFGEELLFRGVLVGAWARAGRPVAGVVISSVLFGLAHATVGPRTVVVTLLLGALLAAAMVLSRSLGAAVLAHACINAVALLGAGLTDPLPIAAVVFTVLLTTAAATAISRSVSLPLAAGTLER